MNENHNFLAFDCGATSGRAILGTFSDGAFSMKEVWRFPNKPLCRDGRMYWDFDALREQHVMEESHVGGCVLFTQRAQVERIMADLAAERGK